MFAPILHPRFRLAPLFAIALAACGGGSPEPEPEPEPTAGAETAPPEPPPPPPARVRVLHATTEPAAATASIAFGDAEPAVTSLAYRAASPYLELAPGAHTLHLRGTPSVETGEAPELVAADTPELASEATATAVLVGLAGGEPPLAVVIAPDRSTPPSEGLASVRLFHAMIGVPAVDVCVAGATPREPALPVFIAAQPNQFARGDSGEWADLLPSGEVTLQLRATAAEPCRGRVLGAARFTPAASTNHTLVAMGRTTGRPRADRELLVCTDPPDPEPACTVVPIAAR